MPKAGKHTVRIDFGSPNKDGTVKVKFRIKNDAGGNKFDIVATVRVTKGESAADKAKKVRLRKIERFALPNYQCRHAVYH